MLDALCFRFAYHEDRAAGDIGCILGCCDLIAQHDLHWGAHAKICSVEHLNFLASRKAKSHHSNDEPVMLPVIIMDSSGLSPYNGPVLYDPRIELSRKLSLLMN